MPCFLTHPSVSNIGFATLQDAVISPSLRTHQTNRLRCNSQIISPDALDQAQERLLRQLRKTPNYRPTIAKILHEICEELEHPEVDLTILPPAERIKQGFLKFKREKFLKQPHLFKQLADAQNPKFLVIACCDSRVSPTAILKLEPGEAFIVRNIANLVPPMGESGFPGTSAALEFAVLQLKVENILVIGHSKCGGIRALVSHAEDESEWSDFIQKWIEIGKPARALTMEAAANEQLDVQCVHCEKESVNVSLNNLLTFPWIVDAVRNEKLRLHGGYYDFVNGSFEHWTFKGLVSKF